MRIHFLVHANRQGYIGTHIDGVQGVWIPNTRAVVNYGNKDTVTYTHTGRRPQKYVSSYIDYCSS